MNEILLILHLFGFAMGIAAAFGNGLMFMTMRGTPASAPVLAGITPRFARIGQIGLGLLWITGIILVWSAFGGPQNLPGLFWWKFVLAVLVTVVIALLDVTLRRVRAGDRAAAARLPALGATSFVATILILIIAVFAFD
jgi:hypothetical protein